MSTLTPPTPRPDETELTGPQAHAVSMSFGVEALSPTLQSTASYATYRTMLRDPTIALARMTLVAPIVSSHWSYEADEGVPDDRVEFIQDQFDPAREYIISAMLRALDYGWAAFEKVFTVEGREIRLRKLKPLLHDITEVLVDAKTGAFGGLRQRSQTIIPLEKALLFTHAMEADDHYGCSRLENCRIAWERWNQADEAANRYDSKVAGVMPVVHYPTHPAKVVDRNGTERPVHEIAQELLAGIMAGKGLTVPNEVPLSDDRDGVGPERRRWIIELLEDKGSRQPGFIDRLRYLDSLKMRGYLRPERVALEGQHGTLAEAGAHGDLAVLDCERIQQEIARVVNWHVVDQLLALNYGEDARGSVRIVPAPMQDIKLATVRKLIDAWATTPDGREDLRLWLDFDAILDLVALPKAEAVIDTRVNVGDKEEGGAADIADQLRKRLQATDDNEGSGPSNPPPP